MGLNTFVTNYLRDRVRELAGDDGNGHGGGDALDQIRKLGELRDSGLVTAEEFEAKKAQLLQRA